MSGSVYDFEPLQRFGLDEKVHFSKLKNLSALLHLQTCHLCMLYITLGKKLKTLTKICLLLGRGCGLS